MGFAWKFGFWFSWWFIIGAVGFLTPNPVKSPMLPLVLIPLGISMMLFGLILNAIAGRTLKKFGHFEMKKGIRKPDRVVDIGIYSCMRHPAQFGSIFFGIGVALVTSNVYAILLAGWYAFSAIYFILAIEERETLREFGEDYCRFIASRKPFSLRCIGEGIRVLRDSR